MIEDDLWVVSRKKKLIIRGGSNVSPVEVERVLAAVPQSRMPPWSGSRMREKAR
jgi:acyl-CoA synthetase (AMP-forming)/AMP-acid ligase II